MKFQIQYVDKIKNGFIGMNKFSHKHCKADWKHKLHPEHTIEIKKGLPHSVKVATIAHEKMETYLEKNKHMPYHKAHNLALKFEEKNKPFPSNHIKQRLKQMGAKTR
jgi:hypothetical protein